MGENGSGRIDSEVVRQVEVGQYSKIMLDFEVDFSLVSAGVDIGEHIEWPTERLTVIRNDARLGVRGRLTRSQ